MFLKSLDGLDLGVKGRKTGVPGEKPSESDWDRQISAQMRTRAQVVEVGGTTDDHYADLTPQPD